MTTESSIERPLLFEQSEIAYVDADTVDLPSTNSDDEPVIELTPEQRYLFDAQGWMLVPGLLDDDDVAEMREFCIQLADDPESIPEPQRSAVGGPLARLTDHPFIVGFMNEFLAHPRLSSQDCYGFRMESTSLARRRQGEGEPRPHNGNGLWRMPGDSHNYHCVPGKANSGLTCVVWELNEVEEGGGGTLFLNGSHKSAFLAPESLQDSASPMWTTYSCPPGSLVIFAESTTHSTAPWTSAERDRVAVFSRYNHVNSRWHNWNPHPDYLAGLSRKRRTLFRPIHVQGNLVEV